MSTSASVEVVVNETPRRNTRFTEAARDRDRQEDLVADRYSTYYLSSGSDHDFRRESTGERPRYSEVAFSSSLDDDDFGTVQRWRPRISLRNSCIQRTPKGKGRILVFSLSILKSAVFYGATGIILRSLLGPDASSGALGYFITIALDYSIARFFYPIAGVLADAYLGRLRMLHLSLWLFWVAFSILALAQSVLLADNLKLILPIISFSFIAIASGSFEVNIISFGIDQLPRGASSAEMSGYFYWYYFGRQTGVFLGLALYLALFIPLHREWSDVHNATYMSHVATAAQSIVAVFLLTVALILIICLKDWFHTRHRKSSNPLWLICRVLWFVATVRRQLSMYRRAFRYNGGGRKSRIDLAKKQYNGIFTNEEVEDVKTFCQLLLLIYSLSGFFMAYAAAVSMYSYQINNLLDEVFFNSTANIKQYLFSNAYNFCNLFTVLISIHIVNYLRLPNILSSTTKLRLGAGILLGIASLTVAAYLDWATSQKHPQHKLLWYILPVVLLGMAEMFVMVNGLEFVYAQSPESMKGLISGLFYLMSGVSSGGAGIFFYQYRQPQLHCYVYYIMFAVIASLGFIAYCIVAFLYTNRQRLPSEPQGDFMHLLHTGRYTYSSL